MRYQPHTWDRNHHVVEQGRWLVRVYQWCIHRYGLSVSPHRANAHLTLDRATPHSFHKHSTGTHPTGEQAALHHCYHSVQQRCYGGGLPRSVAKAPTTGCARKYEPIARMQRTQAVSEKPVFILLLSYMGDSCRTDAGRCKVVGGTFRQGARSVLLVCAVIVAPPLGGTRRHACAAVTIDL